MIDLKEVVNTKFDKVVNIHDVPFVKFSAGEVGTNVEIGAVFHPQKACSYLLVWDKEYSNDLLMHLLQIVDIIKNINQDSTITLFMPYVPYGRQDRYDQNKKFSFSLEIFTSMINQCNFRNVIVMDSHSDVTTALIDRVVNVTNQKLFNRAMITIGGCDRYKPIKDTIIMSPDAGAYKKVFDTVISCPKHVKDFNIEVESASKHRDMETGALSGCATPSQDYSNKTVIIVDDICDGGGTFQMLAQKLKDAGCTDIHLIVTHGIFSRGIDDILDEFTSVHTTDSFTQTQKRSDLHVYGTLQLLQPL